MVKLKKSKAVLKAHNSNAIKYQISIRGPKASSLDNTRAGSLVLRHINGDSSAPYQIRIKVWRGGQELDWRPQPGYADNARSEILRANLRRALQAGRVAFRKVGNP